MIKIRRPDFQAIPPMTRTAPYGVDVPWSSLIRYFEQHVEDGLNIDPDFQRPHVWTLEKQTAYLEFCLRGGQSGNNVYLNCPGWNRGDTTDYVLVDGKQRLRAIMGFLQDEVPVFGYRYSEFSAPIRRNGPSIRWNVSDLGTRAEVLQWYLDLNTGGVVHTAEEIGKVQDLLEEEIKDTVKVNQDLSPELYQQLKGLPCDLYRGKDETAYQRCVKLVKAGLAIQHGYADYINFQPSPAGWRLASCG